MATFSSNGGMSGNHSIWSPATIDVAGGIGNSGVCTTSSSLDTRTTAWSQAAAVAAATSPAAAANCYQNYGGYYSNMDYIGPTVQQQLAVSKLRPFNHIYTEEN